jgi:penicillin-binding protein 2
MRYYPDTNDFAHLLGFVWTPDVNDVKRLGVNIKTTPHYVGKTGIEKVYDTQLLGKQGESEMEVDAKRRPIRQMKRDAPSPGDQLILTIDADLQKWAEFELKGYKGAIVAMDPKTGEILACASSPTYDSGLFLGGINSIDYDKLRDDPDKPMFNRALGAHYAPGSTFKIVTSIAAQEEGKLDPNYEVVCDGGYKIGNRFVKCLGHHGSITYQRAMTVSCNTYFSDLAYRSGEKALQRACQETGLGEREGVDMTGESRGIVPTEKWIKKNKVKWHGGDTVNFGIGQGYVEATPLQMASLLALVANDGVSYRPHFLHAFRHPGQKDATIVQPEVGHKVDLPPTFWATLKAALVEVVENPHGTATVCQIDGLVWGGKTGSAEKHGQDKTNSWFVGFAPSVDSRIVVAVVVEGVGHGNAFGAPMARSVVNHYLFRKVAGATPPASPDVLTPASDDQ